MITLCLFVKLVLCKSEKTKILINNYLRNENCIQEKDVKNKMNNNEWNGEIWKGVYKTFADACGDEDVFEGNVWLEKQITQVNNFLEQMKIPGTISQAALTSEYALPIVAATMVQSNCTIRILDFGGGIATSFLPLIALLPEDQSLEFVVVENETICKVGNKLFKEEKRLKFSTTIPVDNKFDIIHAGSSFHYVDDWIALLNLFARIRPHYLIFADLPAGDIDTFVTIQNYYGRKIPVRFWNIKEFIVRVEKLGFKLLMKSRYHSEYLNYMKNFDQDHRLNYFSQLIFKSF